MILYGMRVPVAVWQVDCEVANGYIRILYFTLVLTVMLIIISFPSPTHSVISGLKPSHSANPSHCSLSFSSSGLTTWIPQTLTVTFQHIRYLLFSFSVLHF